MATLLLADRVCRAAPLSLAEAIALASQRNPDLRAAEREIDAARARMRQAGALEAPELSADVGKLGTSISGEEHEAELRLTQRFSFPGQRSAAKEVARFELALSEANRDARLLELRGEVTRAYRRMQAAEAARLALSGLRATARDLEDLTQVRLRTGSARYLDLLRARAERVRLENDLLAAERDMRQQGQALGSLLAFDATELMVLADSLAFQPFVVSLDSVLADARRSRPRIRAARLELEREAASITAAQRARLPEAEIGVGLDRVPGTSQTGWGGGLTLSLPFVPWAGSGARVDETRASESAARARLESVERSVDAAARSAYAAVMATQKQVQSFEGLLLADGRDAIRTAVQNYQAGQIDGLELFETLRIDRTIQLEYIRALLDYELARTDLSLAE